MSDWTRYFHRLTATSFADGEGLPSIYQAEQFVEGHRVHAETLAPRGLQDRRVLLLGGAGYVGSVVTAQLLQRGYPVRCLDLLLYGNQSCVLPFFGHPLYDFRRADMADPAALAAALEGVTDVIVLAGIVGDPITRRYPDESRLINEEAVQGLLPALTGIGLNKLIFVSTCSNYGEIPSDAIAAETYPLKPLSAYAKAKVAMETRLLGANLDFHPTVLRFATAFGLSPRMRFDLTISEFTRALHAGDTLEVYDSDTWRPYCHVQDFGRALIRVLEAPVERVSGEVFNVGGDVNNFTKAMIVETILKTIPSGSVRLVEGGQDRRNYRVDFSKIHERLFFEPSHTVADGIRELAAALDQGLFDDVAQRPDFYHNRGINYRPVA